MNISSKIAKALSNVSGRRFTATDIKEVVAHLANDNGPKIYTVTQSGHSYSNRSQAIYDTLFALGYTTQELLTWNDAPRGGKTGNHYVINRNDLNEHIKNMTGIDPIAYYTKQRIEEREQAIIDQEAKRLSAEEKGKREQAIIDEAASINIDATFQMQLTEMSGLSGKAKSDYAAHAMKGLLDRNGKAQVDSDFWKVFRILKSKADKVIMSTHSVV